MIRYLEWLALGTLTLSVVIAFCLIIYAIATVISDWRKDKV